MSDQSELPTPAKAPVFSIAALCCPPLVLAIIGFLATPQGQSFNERVFGRYYTAGARKFGRGPGTINWWRGALLAASAFCIPP